jgi:hypothetical protein
VNGSEGIEKVLRTMIILNSLEEKLIFYQIMKLRLTKIKSQQNKFYKCRARAVIPEEYAHVDYLTNIDVLGLTKYQHLLIIGGELHWVRIWSNVQAFW